MSDTSGGGSSGNGYYGQQGLTDGTSQYNRHSFAIRQELLRVRTHVPVKVVAVHGGGIGPPPTVDVQIQINQIDGQGNSTKHGTIYGIPVTRHQAGDAVIINDPIVGDVGTMAVHDRDISSLVANNGEQSNPGSFRRHDVADGVYHHGSMLNQTTPQHYIHVNRDSNGKVQSLDFVTPTMFKINGIVIDKDGNAEFPGYIKAKGNITAGDGTGDSVTLQNHIHPGTDKPVAGT